MAGKFALLAGNISSSTMSPVNKGTTTPDTIGPAVNPVDGREDSGTEDDGGLVTDTLAGLVAAVLALVLLLLVVCVIRVIRKRRRERQGTRLDQPRVHTISTAYLGASVAAYRSVPVAGNISWENVETSRAPILEPRPVDHEVVTSGSSVSHQSHPNLDEGCVLNHSPQHEIIVAGPSRESSSTSHSMAASISFIHSSSSSFPEEDFLDPGKSCNKASSPSKVKKSLNEQSNSVAEPS